MKIGICTGGGDCPGLNAAIRAAVKHGIRNHQMEFTGILDSFNGLQDRPMRTIPLKNTDVMDILHRGGTILGTFNRGCCFSGADGDHKLQLTKEGFDELKLDALIVIGGEGTQGMSSQLIQAGIPVIGIPKTIDNDLPGTDTTIGFSSCVDLVADSVHRLRSTAESHDRIMILEVMGRDSGYIALHGGVAGGCNVVLIPEIPFSWDSIISKINFRKKLGRNFSLIVVSEGAVPAGEQTQQFQTTPDGRQVLGGIGQIVGIRLQKETGMETRVTVLGHLQRGGQPNPQDRLLASQMGIHAIDLLAQGLHNQMVIKKGDRITHIPFSDISANSRRKISSDDQLLKAAEGLGICLGR
ncbi:MAG: ATP-dependent 6-phosphofructokinase [Deltaproteobacteria bacterium]|nr:ATP-dependent 6-phosphofructokinase [Deltaproteobacteria bacterium]